MNTDLDRGYKPLEPHREKQSSREPQAPPEKTLGPAPTLRQQQSPYYSPPPGADDPPPRAKPWWRTPVLAAVLIVAVGVGGWYAFRPGQERPAHVASTTSEAMADKGLLVAASDADSKATSHLQTLFSGSSVATGSAAALDQDDNQPDALNAANAEALQGLAQDSPEMAKELQSGRRVLYRVHLLDYLRQDGDVVEMFVDGVSLGPVSLSNAGTEVLIPLARHASAQIRVVATADGGGGVTFGMVSSLDEAKTRVMQVGQSEQWMVTVK